MAILAIVRRDLDRHRRNPVRTALLFAMPLVVAGVFGLAFGGGDSAEISIRVLLWDEDDSLLSVLAGGMADSAEAGSQLDVVPVGEEGLEMMENGEASALVHIPDGFTDAVLAGEPVTVEVVKNPSQRFLPQVVEEGVGVGAAVLSAGSRALRPELEQIKAMMDSEEFPTDLAVASLSTGINHRLKSVESVVFPPVITLESTTAASETEQDGDELPILAYFLPGLAVMGVFFIVQSATRDVLRDREAGLLRQLLTAPVSPLDYLAGKSLSVVVVGVLGFTVLILVGVAAGVPWGPVDAVAALVLATAVAAAGTLMLIMSIARTERQGDALTTIVIISWSMLGGVFLPIPQMPAFLKTLASSTLTYWAVDGFNTLILDGGGLSAVLANLAVLLVAGGLCLVIGAALLGRRIRKGAV